MWYGWWWWIAFVVIFLFLPLTYGWGYRGWGPPYRRRRPVADGVPDEDLSAGWGGLALLFWIALFVAIVWAFAGWGWGWGY